MKIPQYRRLNRADLGDIPDWADRILETVQLQLETISLAMNSNLTPADNFRGEMVTVSLTHAEESVLKVKDRPAAIFPAWVSDGCGVAGFSWRTIDQTVIGVTIMYSQPTEARTATVRLLLLGD